MPSRLAAYAAVLDGAGADAFVLTSEPAVRHASGVDLYTQRLIPQRPIVCVVAPPARVAIVACVLERDQLEARFSDLELRYFAEFGEDPWAEVARLLPARACVVVEDTMPAAWLESLRERLAGAEVAVSYDLPAEPRRVKDEGEQALLGEASRVAERALAAGAALVGPGRTEREVADAIRDAFLRELSTRASEVDGVCVAPQANRFMHHRAGATVLPESGPVRLGVVGRVDGYWVLITRMLVLGRDERFADEYRRYLGAYEEGLRTLRAGASARELYARCRERVARGGFTLETLKIGHGTGLDFRERPWLAPHEELALAPGMVLAYDYGLESERGVVLHLEDRVLVTEDAPRRLSDGWELSDLEHGFRGLV